MNRRKLSECPVCGETNKRESWPHADPINTTSEKCYICEHEWIRQDGVDVLAGTEGQDRRNYTDTQDRKNYT